MERDHAIKQGTFVEDDTTDAVKHEWHDINSQDRLKIPSNDNPGEWITAQHFQEGFGVSEKWQDTQLEMASNLIAQAARFASSEVYLSDGRVRVYHALQNESVYCCLYILYKIESISLPANFTFVVHLIKPLETNSIIKLASTIVVSCHTQVDSRHLHSFQRFKQLLEQLPPPALPLISG